MTTISASTTLTTAYVCSPDTTGTLVLKTGSTPTTAVTIDSSQNVGIGTSSPGYPLDVLGDMQLKNNSSNYSRFKFGQYNTTSSYTFIQGDGRSSGNIAFYTDVTERMRIDSSGNVGIGTSSPASKLDVLKQGNSAGGTMMLSGSKTNNGIKYGYVTGAHYTSDTYTQGVGIIGCTSFSGENNISIGGDLGEVIAATNIKFWTAANSTTGGGTERARIDSSGNLMVGQTSTGSKFAITQSIADWCINLNAVPSGTQYFTVFRYNGTLIGQITGNNTSTAYTTTSDYRLKENVQPMTSALATVAQLKPVTYTWKEDGSEGQGFIAHELQAVVPDAVVGEKDATKIEQYEISPAVPATFDEEGNELTPAVEAVMGEREVPAYQGIDTSFLVATLTAAIQEQQAIITTLTERITALENK